MTAGNSPSTQRSPFPRRTRTTNREHALSGGLIYRKKPVEVLARLWDGSEDSARAITEWARGAVDNDGGYLSVNTLEGTMRANPGDWVIRGVQGEFYPCKPDIFDATYEPVPTTYEVVP